MKDLFVTYEQAVQLKELGFDEPCFGSWEIEKTDIPTYTHSITTSYKNSNHPIGKTTAPLKQQVFRWFRDKHNILGSIYSNASGYLFEWHDSIGGTHRGWSEYEGPNDGGCWDSYEEAEDACITKLIEIIKEK